MPVLELIAVRTYDLRKHSFRARAEPGTTAVKATALLPFDGSRGLGRDVVDHAVHAVDLVDDTVGDAREERIGEADPVGGHAVAALDRADGDGVLVGAFVAHDADGAHGEEDGESLPDLVVEVGLLHLVDDDLVGAAQDGELAGRDFADAADGESGAGEGLAHDHFLGEAALTAPFAP